MTPEEVDGLPVGPLKHTERPITMEDIKRGMMGRVVVTLESVPVKLTRYKPDDQIAYRDSKGLLWTISEWADGQKFKEPFWLP